MLAESGKTSEALAEVQAVLREAPGRRNAVRLASEAYKAQKELIRRHAPEDDVVRRCLETLDAHVAWLSHVRPLATLPIKIGRRQVETLSTAAVVDFEAFYAARRPGAR